MQNAYLWLLVLLLTAAKILAVKAGYLFTQLACLVSLPALFEPATSALVLFKQIFSN
jgi:hypothetical protein